ncbi:hypothetical protein [Flammeovirga aprica]|uniref:Uncharacterized protein n=1 Tax=Flammeovirga aprica JL-4 TaxID=694437 RepID=A0A7X9NZW1_9BACT|nr:hypothetical protein [Flammeovirga aprica]NME67001.1 hypothetical protein [Flammeovirga aprica JL-4]
MQRLLIFLFLFSVSGTLLFAQKKDKKKKNDMIHEATKDLENQSQNLRDSMVFFHPEWENGNLSLKDGTVFKDVPLLYDLERDQVEVLQIEDIELYGGEGMKDTTVLIFEQHEIDEFDFIAHTLDENEQEITVPHHFVNAERFYRDELPAIGIYEIVEEGKVGVIAYPYLWKIMHRTTAHFDPERRRELENSVHDVKGRQAEVYYSFELKEKLYLLLDGKVIYDLDVKRKTFLKVFEGKEEEINEYMRKSGLQYKNREDLIKIVNHYNGLAEMMN